MNFEYTPPQTPMEIAFGGHRCVNAFGPINPNDDERLLEFLRSSDVPPRTDVYINSGGGHVEAAMSMGRILRDSWLSTHVGQYLLDDTAQLVESPVKQRRFIDGSCMSAATLFYLGGRLRFLSPGSQFGVHQFSFRNPVPAIVGRSQILSSKIARYISDMGIPPEFLELSALTESTSVDLVDHENLRKLSVVTDGETSVEWSVQSRGNTLYVRGERDSFYGHHKVCLGFAAPNFYLHTIIESQGRQEQLVSAFPLVELSIGMTGDRAIDLSDRCIRVAEGIYTNVISTLTTSEAIELAESDGFGLRIRAASDAPLFLGIAPMATKGAEDLIRSFVNCLSNDRATTF
ncbi:hypothetical protein NKJ36_28750 [Mesorhizobium sp. M0142]|uniref:COG3904 family protein n=1 Tax=Mesorhizobium sp. M0142 TaxID=2956894 RepID=UPI0033393B53